MNRPLPQISSLSSVKPLAQRCMSVVAAQCASANWVQQISGVVGIFTKSPAINGDYVHPCVVEQHKTLVHARDLAYRNPEFYVELQSYAAAEGYVLLADRRQRDSAVQNDRRSGFLPVLMLSLGLNAAVVADDHHSQPIQPVAELQSTLSLFDSAPVHLDSHDHKIHSTGMTSVQEPVDPEADSGAFLSSTIVEILKQHYQPASSDPEYIEGDLQAMAEYFSRYPQAVELLVSLKDYNWQLSYAKDTFETQVRGSQIQVRSVKVNFDSRAAAQLNSHRSCLQDDKRGACVASPADALLHELLHARSALLDSQTFIAQGGMNSVLYPYEHEATVIQDENMLYQAMSTIDSAYRPSRHSHQGRVLASACVTCLQ